MSNRGKRYKAFKEKLNKDKSYSVKEAVKLLKDNSNVKFDETLDIAINLGVDPKHADQIVRGVVDLPNGTGKKFKIAVFAKDNKAEEAKTAGAEYVGQEDLALKFEKENLMVDRVIATPDMMSIVGKLGKVLGPKGLMPNPKLGTVTNDLSKIIASIKAGQIEFKADKSGIVHAGIGKLSFTEKKLEENCNNFLDAIIKAKPKGAKGTYLKNVFISPTMGPSLRLDYK